ncbi:hypothetical protein [Shinella sp. YE25]|uniref:hypothetical protein n=1 Tax=Shinella sp. YE25 TaxID=2862958 RepID=UPI00225D1447|nr:hypothetical protein [Shinella sp. YE25]CAI0341150.1 conserved exported hypothetical protein [Rhizobiaceae bacterium]CAK7262185.1 conserved exported protein of unknown function [Shinella sp. WSC3-e]
MSCVLRLIVAAGFLSALPIHAATLLCAPVAVTESVGTSGPLTISAAEKELGNPVLFWIDTETGELQEHAEGGDRFITYTGKLDVQQADANVFLAHHAEQNEFYRIDLGVTVHPFQRSVDGALTAIGTCNPAAMGELPQEDNAPVWPFTYRKAG